MRYMVAQYLHKHPGKLPLGDDPAIRDATWGISYAYYPILSYMVSAVFMGIAGLFHALPTDFSMRQEWQMCFL